MLFDICRYCGTRLPKNQDRCHACGAPNSPEPEPWYKIIRLRVKASLVSKQDSVWSDRLIALIPLKFIVVVVFLIKSLLIIKAATFAPLSIIICAALSIFMLLLMLALYPDWYKESPKRRKDLGTYYFLFLIAYVINIFLAF